MSEAQINSLRHRIALCSMRDVVAADGSMELSRVPQATLWAQIEVQSNLPSFVSRQSGYVVMEAAVTMTHRITIRYQVDLDITSAAWVYEERRKSPPRWYKVLGFEEDEGRWLMLICHLVEKSELAQPPQRLLGPQPSSVVL